MTSDNKTLLILDLETPCLLEEARARDEFPQPTEIGGVLYSITYKKVINTFSYLIPSEWVGEEASEITGITPELTTAYNAKSPFPYQTLLRLMLQSADYIGSYGMFDRDWLMECHLIPSNIPWVDFSPHDFPYRNEFDKRKRRELTALANAHNVLYYSHRAIDDCLALARIFQQYNHLEELIQYSLEPQVMYRSLEPYPGAVSKSLGFMWNTPEYPKQWVKGIREKDLYLYADIPLIAIEDTQSGLIAS